jgi:hypothetical protein
MVIQKEPTLAKMLLENVPFETWQYKSSDVSALTEESAEMAIDSALAIG